MPRLKVDKTLDARPYKQTTERSAFDLPRLNAAKARETFSEMVNRTAYGKERFIVSRHGKDLMAVIPIEDLHLLERLRDKEDRLDAQAARKALATPRRIPYEQVRRKLGL